MTVRQLSVCLGIHDQWTSATESMTPLDDGSMLGWKSFYVRPKLRTEHTFVRCLEDHRRGSLRTADPCQSYMHRMLEFGSGFQRYQHLAEARDWPSKDQTEPTMDTSRYSPRHWNVVVSSGRRRT